MPCLFSQVEIKFQIYIELLVIIPERDHFSLKFGQIRNMHRLFIDQ